MIDDIVYDYDKKWSDVEMRIRRICSFTPRLNLLKDIDRDTSLAIWPTLVKYDRFYGANDELRL